MKAAGLLDRSVSELAALLSRRQVSSVELTRACLDRIEALDPQLHAFATVTRDLALQQAREADAGFARGTVKGPLQGVPFGLKDLVATKGIKTTWGARPYQDVVPDRDAAIVASLRAAGAVLIGKLAMVELAGGLGYSTPDASLTGAARNPWNLDRWTCGSSSGSGAAVSAGLVPFAIGSETWGSIVCPASFCGISGLRPTFGRVSRRGAMALSWSLDKLGPMARTAQDCETVLRVIAGHDPGDPYSADEPLGAPSDPATARRLRVACLRPDFAHGGDRSVQRIYERALDELRHGGVRIEDASLPDLPFDSVTSVILAAEAATAFEDLERSGRASELKTADAPLTFIVARAVRGSDVVKAQRIRTLCQRAMADFFGRYDVLLFPGEMTTALPADKDFSEVSWPDPAGAAGNLCGLPAMAVPCGLADDGLPVSLTAMSGAFEESKAIALMRAYQAMTNWHTLRPPIVAASHPGTRTDS